MPISILYYKVSPESISSSQQSAQIADWIEELPIIKQKQVKKLRQQNDQVLSLAGLQLLKIAMSEYPDTLFSLAQLQFPKHGKPFFKGDIDFNISHSGDIVCCVLSDTVKVGIDIELQREVNPATMNKFVTESDCSAKKNSANNQQRNFFNLWTKNEAIIKAANLGSIYNMKDIKHKQKGALYQNKFWSTYPVEIISVEDNKEYTCHIACSEDVASQNIKTKQIYNL
jgi:4'-phosphopantetheinyl transferase